MVARSIPGCAQPKPASPLPAFLEDVLRRIPVVCLVLLAAACLPLAAQSAAKPLTVDVIYGHGPMIGHPPSELTWSPDSKHLTYLEKGELMEIALSTGKPQVLVSREQMAKLAGGSDTEKDRDHRERYKMASYLWSPDARSLLFDVDGKLWLYDLAAKTGEQVGSTGSASGNDPKFSPDGKQISFIRNHGLAVLALGKDGKAVDVAPAPNDSTWRGEVDWVYSEELDVRTNYIWAPDSARLAFLEMDESALPVYPLTDWIPVHGTVDGQRYPQPGDPNPSVRLGVARATGGDLVWVKLPLKPGNDYIPRFGWADANTVWIETLTRDQKHQTFYLADATTGEAKQVLEIVDAKFVNDQYDAYAGNGKLLVKHWGDGYEHLYLYTIDTVNKTPAVLVRQLTKGMFDVGDVYRVDFAAGVVDYVANEGKALEQQLWRVDFKGQRKQLTEGAGFHAGSVAPSGEAFVDRNSSFAEAPVAQVCQASGCHVFWKTDALKPYNMRRPIELEVKASDGSTLYATLLLPEGATAKASVPLITNPYGGPGTQSLVDRWGDAHAFDELLTQHGFAVLHADNRGMGGRGRDFEQACYHNFGPVQLEDQLAVIDAALAKYPQLDPKRLGWWGWSWGGTFTLNALSHSDRFRAGVSVAPVTDWRNYDSIYTERYMSQPSEFPQGYKDFSVVNSAANLKGHLLLVHGTGDDNVHIANSVQYIQKLIEAGKPYDLQIYPRKTHSIAGADVRTHLFNRIVAHFETYLKPVE